MNRCRCFLPAALLAAGVLLSSFLVPDVAESPQMRYIEKYSALAIDEMYRSGVPASITLAQGLLESRYGLSELATKGNNHFGIKCHNNWQGGKVYHDDDLKGECFRKYDSPEESFRDHSDFLRYRDRYKFLFDLEVNDYKGWAHGLKKAGYATDPAYPTKLIKLIEDYGLFKYDVEPSDYGYQQPDDVEEYVFIKPESSKKAEKKVKKDDKKFRKTERHNEQQQPKIIPESPTKVETPVLIEKKPDGEFSFFLTRKMYSLNGVAFVYTAKGETYGSIAEDFGLFQREILKFNDLKDDSALKKELPAGTLVYIQSKKNEAARGIEKHVLDVGDSMWTIAQRYGVKLEKIYKMNSLNETYVPREGDIIRLRKKK